MSVNLLINFLFSGIFRDVSPLRYLPRDWQLPSHRGLHRPELELPGPEDQGGEHPPPLLRHPEPARGHEVAAEVGGCAGPTQQQWEDAAQYCEGAGVQAVRGVGE